MISVGNRSRCRSFGSSSVRETPYRFVRGLLDEALDHLVDSLKLPSWADEEYLQDHLRLALKREVTSWNVEESLIIDKEGEVSNREYIRADFDCTLRWDEKPLDCMYIDFEWENGEFKALSSVDISNASKAISKVISVPSDAGYYEEFEI